MAKVDNEEVQAYKDVLNNAYEYMRYTDLTFFDIRQIITETFTFCNVDSISDLKNDETKCLIIEILEHQLRMARYSR